MMKHAKFSRAASAVLMIVIVFTLMLVPGAWAQSKYKTLYNFTGSTGGNFSQGQPNLRSPGNLYSTTTYGGAGYGTVFELTPNQDGSWTESVLYSFAGGTDGGTPEPTLIFDQPGNLYGTTFSAALMGLATSSS